MELPAIILSLCGGLLTILVGWLTYTLRDHQRRLNVVEKQCISYEQMEKYVELKQAPLYVLVERMAEDIHQLRRLMEKQYEQNQKKPD